MENSLKYPTGNQAKIRMNTPSQDDRSVEGTFRNGALHLSAPVDWPEGARVRLEVQNIEEPDELCPNNRADRFGRVIIAGFGPPGRWVAEIFQRHKIEFVVVDLNETTVRNQAHLGIPAIAGNIARPEVLKEAGIERAAFLLLTIPDEKAVVEATRIARQLNPDVYIVAPARSPHCKIEAHADSHRPQNLRWRDKRESNRYPHMQRRSHVDSLKARG